MVEKVRDVVVDSFGHTIVQREHGEAEVFVAEYDAIFSD